MQIHERIVIAEDTADLAPEPVIRERVPANEVRMLEAVIFAGTGPARGEYEAARMDVDYIPPKRSAA